MYCQKAALKNFRNIKEAQIEFSEGINILVGENAQGKTNLLEALFYASVCRSFRATNTAEMIKFGENSAEISIDYKQSAKTRTDRLCYKLSCDKKRTVQKNNLKVERLSDIIGSFRAVLFCPEHLSLIKDGPSERRSYLDIAISRISPKYIHSLQRYNYFLKQRNSLIKSAYNDRAVFDATVSLWSEKMAEEAAIISKERASFVKRVEKLSCEYFAEMTKEKEVVSMIYKGSANLDEDDYYNTERVKEKYFSLLMSAHDREIAIGSTLYGIHKDDIDIRLNQKSARSYASQGQQRSLALAMKLSEGEICKEMLGDYPVFLFDDVLSELDDIRRDYLILNATNETEKQLIITTCERKFVEGIKANKIISVKDGRYTEE